MKNVEKRIQEALDFWTSLDPQKLEEMCDTPNDEDE